MTAKPHLKKTYIDIWFETKERRWRGLTPKTTQFWSNSIPKKVNLGAILLSPSSVSKVY